jgi:GNAT superfamily N-acetyltransferase
VRLREVTPDDLDALAGIFGAIGPAFKASGLGEPIDEAKALIDGRAVSHGVDAERRIAAGLALRGEGRLVGVLELLDGVPDAESVHIAGLYLVPDAHAKGIGSDVVEAIARTAKARGVRALRVAVLSANGPALRFWTSRGFDRITGLQGPGLEAVDELVRVELTRDIPAE